MRVHGAQRFCVRWVARGVGWPGVGGLGVGWPGRGVAWEVASGYWLPAQLPVRNWRYRASCGIYVAAAQITPVLGGVLSGPASATAQPQPHASHRLTTALRQLPQPPPNHSLAPATSATAPCQLPQPSPDSSLPGYRPPRTEVTREELAVYRRLRRICRSCSNNASSRGLVQVEPLAKMGQWPGSAETGARGRRRGVAGKEGETRNGAKCRG